eukprot:SM000041S15529  [mRNA]  locus=s41:661619:663377:+ [translate_table: standard]
MVVESPGGAIEDGERALAAALASGRRATLLEFYSPRCRLCASLLATLADVEARDADWLAVVTADVENRRWLPEASAPAWLSRSFLSSNPPRLVRNPSAAVPPQVVHYEVKYVPCFVLLDARGNALAKSGVPYSRRHVVRALSYLLESMRPIKSRRPQPPPRSAPSPG